MADGLSVLANTATTALVTAIHAHAAAPARGASLALPAMRARRAAAPVVLCMTSNTIFDQQKPDNHQTGPVQRAEQDEKAQELFSSVYGLRVARADDSPDLATLAEPKFAESKRSDKDGDKQRRGVGLNLLKL